MKILRLTVKVECIAEVYENDISTVVAAASESAEIRRTMDVTSVTNASIQAADHLPGIGSDASKVLAINVSNSLIETLYAKANQRN